MAAISPASYRLATNFLYPAAAAWTLYTAGRARNWRYARERLSGRCMHGQSPIWVHCASVGELNTAAPLVRAWLERHPGERFVITTNTPTAAAVFAAKRFSVQVKHRYMPVDYSRHCARFIASLRPKTAWIMETELWLNMFSACAAYNVPVFIVNARLSEKTLRAARHPYMHSYYRHCLSMVAGVLVRHENEVEKYQRCGASMGIVSVVGNLKYAVSFDEKHPNLITRRPYFLAASTHANEEVLAAQAFRRACGAQDHLLVIAPRHPQRGPSVARQLQQAGFRVARRGAGEPIDAADIYIADTVGELPALISHARLVFMGGTLVPVGGHNVLEPAVLGAPQVVGPYIDNYTNEVLDLRAARAVAQVASGKELSETFQRAARGELADMARRAREFARGRQGVVKRYLDALAYSAHRQRPVRTPPSS